MLIVTAMILLLEIRLLHTTVLELSAATIGRQNAPIELGRWRLPLFGLALVWTLVTVALPIAVLIVQSASLSAFADAFSRASDSILRSVVFASLGATLLTLLGFFPEDWARRCVAGPSRQNARLDRVVVWEESCWWE
jgi:ABC-type Fe3+ transport system permease subunit